MLKAADYSSSCKSEDGSEMATAIPHLWSPVPSFLAACSVLCSLENRADSDFALCQAADNKWFSNSLMSYRPFLNNGE